ILVILAIWFWDRTASHHWVRKTVLTLVAVASMGALSYIPIAKQYRAEHALKVTPSSREPQIAFDTVVFNVVDRTLPPESNGRITVFNAYNNTQKVVAATFLAMNTGDSAVNSRSFVACVPSGLAITEPFDLFKWDDAKAVSQTIGARQTAAIGG